MKTKQWRGRTLSFFLFVRSKSRNWHEIAHVDSNALLHCANEQMCESREMGHEKMSLAKQTL